MRLSMAVKPSRPPEFERTSETRTRSFSSPWYASTVERTSPSRPHAAKPARSRKTCGAKGGGASAGRRGEWRVRGVAVCLPHVGREDGDAALRVPQPDEQRGEAEQDLGLVAVLGREQVSPHPLRRRVRDEVRRLGHPEHRRARERHRVVAQLRVDGREQPRDLRPHPPLRAQPHVRHVVVERALEEGDGEAVVERELVAGGGGAQLLVVADEEQLRGRLPERGEHVRLEHLTRGAAEVRPRCGRSVARAHVVAPPPPPRRR